MAEPGAGKRPCLDPEGEAGQENAKRRRGVEGGASMLPVEHMRTEEGPGTTAAQASTTRADEQEADAEPSEEAGSGTITSPRAAVPASHAREEGSGDHAQMSPGMILKVKAKDGTQVHFKIGKTTKLGKLMEAYCERQALALLETHFYFAGTRLHHTQTPEDLNMQDDDVIIAIVGGQTGDAVPASHGLVMECGGESTCSQDHASRCLI
ncbi:MAG: ubiquitin-like protein [Promethearchaeia archaeon]